MQSSSTGTFAEKARFFPGQNATAWRKEAMSNPPQEPAALARNTRNRQLARVTRGDAQSRFGFV